MTTELEFVRGDSIRFTVRCTRADAADVQQPIDLTGAHLWCTVKKTMPDGLADDKALVQVETPIVSADEGISILNQVTNKGQAQILIPKGATQEVDWNATYAFDVQVLEPDGRLSTPVEGTMKFIRDVTYSMTP